jgi:beta-alanine degradation protein BauB
MSRKAGYNRRMRLQLMAGFVLCVVAAAQQPIPASQLKQRTEILRNEQVTVYAVEVKPDETVPMHTHQQDNVTVFINGASRVETIRGKLPRPDRQRPGSVRYEPRGLTHSSHNPGNEPWRITSIDFARPQGKVERPKQGASRYCNSGSKKQCVQERYLFCTERVCVEDVTIAPGAITTKHAHSTDHMLVAVSDYELTDKVEGAATTVRTRKSGEIEYIKSGITHQLTNTGKQPARFIVVAWR